MKANGSAFLIFLALLGMLACGAVLIHLHAAHTMPAHLHGAIHSALPGHGDGESGGVESVTESEAMVRAREGVAAIGTRWDAEAYAETVSLYTAVHREVAWPGVLEPETVRYGSNEQQTFELFRPEQGFSEPGPVFVFLPGNGLGSSDPVAPASDGLIYSNIGKLAATAGGIGLTMSYRSGATATLESGAEDLRLVLEWIVEHIAPYGGDPDTIVLLANAEGATQAAAYLFNENWQMSSGPGVAAVILSSGRFGALEPAIAESVMEYDGEPVPLALWNAEYDPREVTDSINALHDLLCDKYDGCPWLERLQGHNQVSQMMSLGTSDTSALNALIRFYHTVR